MKKPFIRYRSADETSALFYRAKKSPFLLRTEGKLVIVLTVIACVSALALYKALFAA